MAILSSHMMKNPIFAKVVQTKRYVGRILDAYGEIR